MAEALKVNTTVQKVDLDSEWCWCSLPNVHVVVVLTKCVCVCPCVCMWVSVNLIGAAGGTAVAEALKVNTSVQVINLSGEGWW